MQAEDLDDGRLLLDLGAGHLVRREDRHHFLHSFPRFQGLLGPVAFLAQGGDDGQLGAHDDVAAQAELLDLLDDVIDLLLRWRPGFMTTIMDTSSGRHGPGMGEIPTADNRASIERNNRSRHGAASGAKPEGQEKQGGPRRDRRRGPLQKRRLHRRQPVGCVQCSLTWLRLLI